MMAWISKLHLAILTTGTLLGTIIRPSAASSPGEVFPISPAPRQAENTTVEVWRGERSGYNYTGCFTTGPSGSALDKGVNVTVEGLMSAPLCLDVCQYSASFLGDERKLLMDHQPTRHMARNSSSYNNTQVQARAQAECPPDNGGGDGGDSDDNGVYQYAGLGYDSERNASVCVCSDGLVPASEEVPDFQCSIPCDGNGTQSCGGPNHIVLYNLTGSGDDGNHGDDGRPNRPGGGPGRHGAAATHGVSSGALVGAVLVALWSL